MQHFYDNQIRRYVLQITRMMSNFYWKNGDGDLKQIPVKYGNLSRQVANLIAGNSEATLPTVPQMAVYITSLAIDNTRRSDSSYINKLHIRERRYDSAGNEYLEAEGKNYTVERLMPTPYTLSFNVDIWSSNTDQKLQILEQLLVLFNPSLEIQTTDNYVDWTSLTTVTLTNINWSSKSVPQGTDDAIDIATLSLEAPIYINPPAKVKRLGVITNIITSIFADDTGTIAAGMTRPEINQYNDIDNLSYESREILKSDGNGNIITETDPEISKVGNADLSFGTNYQDSSVIIFDNTAQLYRSNGLEDAEWESYINALPFQFKDYVTTIKLRRADTGYEISGTVSLSSTDPRFLDVNFDTDSAPSDTLLEGPNGVRGNVDYVVNPLTFNPLPKLSENPRILILEPIKATASEDGPDAWKSSSGDDTLNAAAGDIIEWSGTEWVVVFDSTTASLDSTLIYTTNLNTQIQYKFDPDSGEWFKSFDGIYPPGTWRLDYN